MCIKKEERKRERKENEKIQKKKTSIHALCELRKGREIIYATRRRVIQNVHEETKEKKMWGSVWKLKWKRGVMGKDEKKIRSYV